MLARDTLLDTGPLVALLRVNDQWHQRCAPLWPELIDRCLTTEAVVTEACHLVGRAGAAPGLALEFLLAANIPILGLEPRLHVEATLLLARYADVPMDYADASLVALANALGLGRVFTTDQRGFSVYRLRRDQAFLALPG